MILDNEFVWLIGIPILFVVLFVLRKRGYGLFHLLFVSVFWVYILLVLKVTIFPIPIARGISDESEMFPLILPLINFTPFYFGRFLTLDKIFFLLVQNIILTIPFGFGINFIVRASLKKPIWLAIVFGFGLELLQFLVALLSSFFSIGTGHIIDINDAILNVVGVLLGYGLFKMFASWYSKNNHNVKNKGLFAYIHEITSIA